MICFIRTILSFVLTLTLWPALALAETTTDTDPWPQLPTYYSHNGELNVTLEARKQKIDLGDVSFEGMTYNGTYGGPVLHAKPGDTLHIHLINHADETTNLHFHGLHASPRGHSDNVFNVVEPNGTFDYDVTISPQQPKGLFWYHSHIHGLTEKQTAAGLSGALIIDDITDNQPALKGMRERLLVLKDHSFETAPNDIARDYYHKFVQTINGQTKVTLAMRPHEKQLLRITNQSADYSVRFAIPNHSFKVLAVDGVQIKTPYIQEVLNVSPAGRVEAILDAGEAGLYDLIMKGLVTGSGASKATDRIMGQMVVSGDPVNDQPEPTGFAYQDLSRSKINAERTVVFAQSKDGTQYFLNGRVFDHARIDTRVPLGSTEMWTIKNDTDDMHVFHIHQMHFQVAEINGQPQAFNGYQDTVRVPEHGQIKIIIPFTDPIIVGKFVYHCHVLEHEDKGMMGNIVVYDPKQFDFSEWLDEAWGRICSTLGWKHTTLAIFRNPKTTAAPMAQFDGHFNLIDHEGKIVSEHSYDGKYRLMFFGYTHCPDACPTALATIDRALQQLGDKSKDVAVLFVSLDPERDTAPVLKNYLSNFKIPMTGLTGSVNQISNIAKNMNIGYAKVADKDADGGYTIDHPAAIYLMDSQGNFVDGISYTASTEELIAFLKKYGATT